jgi:hypothetical protein
MTGVSGRSGSRRAQARAATRLNVTDSQRGVVSVTETSSCEWHARYGAYPCNDLGKRVGGRRRQLAGKSRPTRHDRISR